MHHTLLIAAAAVALAIPIVIAAQGTPIDPPVRVNVITRGLAVGAAGCFVGGVIGAVVGAITTGSWRPIELPPRTGTESDTSPVLTLDSPRVYPPQTTVRFAHAVF
jgi:hypothetical protein